MAKTVENLKTLKQLGFGTFKLHESASYDRSKSVWKLLKHYDSAFDDLKITDADEKSKLVKLIEYDLAEAADNGVPDANTAVAAEKDSYGKIKQKIKIFFGIKKLKEQARDKLSKVTQGDRSANQLLIDIIELWDLAEYGEENSQEQIKEILLRALRDQDIRLQYQLSQLPGRTPLTVESIIAYANEFAIYKASSSSRVNKVYRGGNRNRGRYHNRGQGRSGYKTNYDRQQGQKCTACHSYQHKSGDPTCFARGKTCNKCGFKNHFAAACFTPRGAATRARATPNYNRGRQNLNYGRRQFYKNKKVEAETDNPTTETVDPNALASLLARGCAISN